MILYAEDTNLLGLNHYRWPRFGNCNGLFDFWPKPRSAIAEIEVILRLPRVLQEFDGFLDLYPIRWIFRMGSGSAQLGRVTITAGQIMLVILIRMSRV